MSEPPVAGASQVADEEDGFVAGRWDLAPVFLVVVAGWLTSSACLAFAGGGEGELPAWQKVALTAPGFLVWCALGVLLARRLDPNGTRALGLGGNGFHHGSSGVAWYVPLGLMWWVITIVYGTVLGAAGIEIPRQSVAEPFHDPDLDPAVRVLLVFVYVVAAPAGEETLFRGLLHGWLRRYLSWTWAAAIGGTLFGLLHVEWQHGLATLTFAFPLGVLGVMLAWLRERPGGLWACMGLHGAHNAVALALASTVR